VDITSPNAEQYPGWPRTIKQEDNYGRRAVAYLPTIQVRGMKNPVVQVIDESNDEIVYTLRINGNSYRPKVFKKGKYTVKIGELGTDKMKTLKGIRSLPPDKTKKIGVKF
jgi:alkaline phosphatase D